MPPFTELDIQPVPNQGHHPGTVATMGAVTWRMNLCAVSQHPATPLFFIALTLHYGADDGGHPVGIRDEISIHHLTPEGIAPEPHQVIRPPRAFEQDVLISTDLSEGYINAIKVGYLGPAEVLVAVDELGVICIWRITDLARPWFVTHTRTSTWGLDIHQENCLVAVSSNDYRVTILDFTVPIHHGVDAAVPKPEHCEGDDNHPNGRLPFSDTLTSRLTPHFTVPTHYLTGHRNNVPNIAFSPCGRYLASCSIDRTTIIWDLWTDRIVKRRRISNEWGWSVRFVEPYYFKTTDEADATAGAALAASSFDRDQDVPPILDVAEFSIPNLLLYVLANHVAGDQSVDEGLVAGNGDGEDRGWRGSPPSSEGPGTRIRVIGGATREGWNNPSEPASGSEWATVSDSASDRGSNWTAGTGASEDGHDDHVEMENEVLGTPWLAHSPSLPLADATTNDPPPRQPGLNEAARPMVTFQSPPLLANQPDRRPDHGSDPEATPGAPLASVSNMAAVSASVATEREGAQSPPGPEALPPLTRLSTHTTLESHHLSDIHASHPSRSTSSASPAESASDVHATADDHNDDDDDDDDNDAASYNHHNHGPSLMSERIRSLTRILGRQTGHSDSDDHEGELEEDADADADDEDNYDELVDLVQGYMATGGTTELVHRRRHRRRQRYSNSADEPSESRSSLASLSSSPSSEAGLVFENPAADDVFDVDAELPPVRSSPPDHDGRNHREVGGDNVNHHGNLHHHRRHGCRAGHDGGDRSMCRRCRYGLRGSGLREKSYLLLHGSIHGLSLLGTEGTLPLMFADPYYIAKNYLVDQVMPNGYWRLNMMEWLPEIGTAIVACQRGKVAITRLIRISMDNGESKYGFIPEQYLPADPSTSAPLLGLCVQRLASSDPGLRTYRLHIVFYDGKVFNYQIRQKFAAKSKLLRHEHGGHRRSRQTEDRVDYEKLPNRSSHRAEAGDEANRNAKSRHSRPDRRSRSRSRSRSRDGRRRDRRYQDRRSRSRGRSGERDHRSRQSRRSRRHDSPSESEGFSESDGESSRSRSPSRRRSSSRHRRSKKDKSREESGRRRKEKKDRKKEFRQWLFEVHGIRWEEISNLDSKKHFKGFMEDYNTATMPHKKYYDMAKWEAKQASKPATTSTSNTYRGLNDETYGSFNIWEDQRNVHRQHQQTSRAALQGAFDTPLYTRDQVLDLKRLGDERIAADRLRVMGYTAKKR
ncbi:hypothetical protein IWQ60_007810 [Tieghemiomyces parasiticus]|uniref:WD repeat protein n=1 Tax=Tieghemiomyces parasiticus TaxID=78921 RepID=A0A9W8A4N3_9FUNG|nr:hypothetical protein IWQ60_007810 [Tieghemiomyces parasiticus]